MATRSKRKQSHKSTEIVDEIDGHPLYPQYCFKLSPTVNTYAHMHACDIDALTTHSGFHGQNLFFHLNHPIQWVRVAGIVVAIDEYPGRRIYTVDDSSGVCIECLVDVPRADAALTAAVSGAKVDSKNLGKAELTPPAPKRVVPDEVDVGTLIDVKGGLSLFRGYKQIKILKATILRSTEQEVFFWEKIREFRHDVLAEPWQLTDKEVRRCRKEERRK